MEQLCNCSDTDIYPATWDMRYQWMGELFDRDELWENFKCRLCHLPCFSPEDIWGNDLKGMPSGVEGPPTLDEIIDEWGA